MDGMTLAQDLSATSSTQRRRSMQSLPAISLEDVPLSMRDGEGNGGGNGGHRTLYNGGFETACARCSDGHDRRISARCLLRCRILSPLCLLLRNIILLQCIHPRPMSPVNADAPLTAALIVSATAMELYSDRATHSRHRQRFVFPQKQHHGKASVTETFVEVDDEDDGRIVRSIEEAFAEMDEEGDRVGETFDVLAFFGGERMDQSIVIHNEIHDLKHSLVVSGTLNVSRRETITASHSLSDGSEGRYACPPEWEVLDAGTKAELATFLSWENLSRWDFDITEVARLTRDPLLLVGWAILCPTAQDAIGLSLGLDDERSVKSYSFHKHMTLDPRTVCNFLREAEKRYKHDNPYHSNIHAADVTQTTHCLFQLMDEELLSQSFDPVMIFSLLLAATFHDVGHPGTNNLFEQNAMTPLAIRYNNVSILENMHSAIGNSLLFGEEKRKEWDVFSGWSRQEKARARNIMTTSILGTDMSNHFADLHELDALISKVKILDNSCTGEGDDSELLLSTLVQTLGSGATADVIEEYNNLIDSMLKFFLHAADISNPAKKEKLAVYWADGALAEFFAQGDKEKEMGLPVSPLCDRDTVKRPDSQIGFIKFVTQPTFELLGEIIPRVNKEVMPVIESNLAYWKSEKLRQSQSV